MWHKIKNILLWAVLGGYLIVALGFVADNSKNILCNKVEVKITNNDVNHFLKQSDIDRMLENTRIKMKGEKAALINTMLIEEVINRDPAVRKTAAFTNLRGELIIEITQCNPVVRVINRDLRQYYIDEQACIVPYRPHYFAHTLVANGFISEPFNVAQSVNMLAGNDSKMLQKTLVFDLYRLANYINNNEFWRAQIQQIYVNAQREFELIPRVGAHVIVLGDAANIEHKFKKLKAMYRTFNQIGWNNYKTINLKYKDQVICTKR